MRVFVLLQYLKESVEVLNPFYYRHIVCFEVPLNNKSELFKLYESIKNNNKFNMSPEYPETTRPESDFKEVAETLKTEESKDIPKISPTEPEAEATLTSKLPQENGSVNQADQ